jgi:arginase
MNIHIFGLPSSAGALYKGTELAPGAIRDAKLVEKLTAKGYCVHDKGDLFMDLDLPRHNVAPVRNWPAPRIIWEEIVIRSEELFKEDAFSILLGGDCSIEVGTFHAFQKVYGENSHLLVLDGHVDTIKPQGDRCMGAAGMGLWFLLHDDEKLWWNEEKINMERVSVIGPNINHTETDIQVITYQQLITENYLSLIHQHLNTITSDSILVHLDVDVLHKSIMPAAYSPSEVGLNLTRAKNILELILADPRVKAIEVTEFSADQDEDKRSAELITELLCLISRA